MERYNIMLNTVFKAVFSIFLNTIVSPVGKFYAINYITRQVVWSYVPRDYPNNKILNAEKIADDVYEFTDVYVDELAETFLRHDGSGELMMEAIPLTSKKQVKRDIKSHFPGANITIIRPRIFYFDCSGHRVKKQAIEESEYYIQVKKTEYAISTPNWRMRFYKHKAKFFFGSENFIPIRVYHADNFNTLIRICHSIIGINDKDINQEIWILKNYLDNVYVDDHIETTNVCHGFLGGSVKVTMKLFAESSLFPLYVRDLWAANLEEFEIFYGVGIHQNSYGLVFEHNTFTFYEFITLSQQNRKCFKVLIRNLAGGLNVLHNARELCHTKLNPWNIIINKSMIPKILGFGYLQPLTEDLRDDDLRALAKVIRFCYTNQNLKDLSESDYETKDILIPSGEPEVKDLVGLLENQNGRPISLEKVFAHPKLWANEERIQFLKDGSDFLELDNKYTNSLRKEMYDYRNDYFGFYAWLGRVPNEILRIQREESNYNTNHPSHLLRFIRNIFNHFPNVLSKGEETYTDEDLNWLGNNTLDTERNLWIEFPSFLLDLYKFFELKVPKARMGVLRCYYD